MDIRIKGPVTLSGRVRVSGSKNAALAQLAATLLCDGRVCLQNVPRISDVSNMLFCLAALGVRVRTSEDSISAEPERSVQFVVPAASAVRFRGSILLLAPLLARTKNAVLPLPGGCDLGDRPVDVHLKALSAMGANITVKRGYIIAEARQLRGTTINVAGQHGTSVTGTCTALLASVRAQGRTRIQSAAIEPEVVELGRLLIKMGAQIRGLGTPEIFIDGVDHLVSTSHIVIPDRIEIGTWLIAGALLGAPLIVGPILFEMQKSLIELLSSSGVQLSPEDDGIRVERTGLIEGCQIDLTPYPGLPTDLNPSLAVLYALASKHASIRDFVFPKRFQYLEPLRLFGIESRLKSGRVLFLSRPTAIRATVVHAQDCRASAALALAALAAEGTTTIRGAHHLDRGYEGFDRKLESLGGNAQRIKSKSHMEG
jgi:UDP-N-acetylglucosamine 1-carboxyvinyltransferase